MYSSQKKIEPIRTVILVKYICTLCTQLSHTQFTALNFRYITMSSIQIDEIPKTVNTERLAKKEEKKNSGRKKYNLQFWVNYFFNVFRRKL